MVLVQKNYLYNVRCYANAGTKNKFKQHIFLQKGWLTFPPTYGARILLPPSLYMWDIRPHILQNDITTYKRASSPG